MSTKVARWVTIDGMPRWQGLVLQGIGPIALIETCPHNIHLVACYYPSIHKEKGMTTKRTSNYTLDEVKQSAVATCRSLGWKFITTEEGKGNGQTEEGKEASTGADGVDPIQSRGD